jgi:hypothetical protein
LDRSTTGSSRRFFGIIKDKIGSFFTQHVKPFFNDHPIIGLTFTFSVGFFLTILLFALILVAVKKMLQLLALAASSLCRELDIPIRLKKSGRSIPIENFGRQLKITQKNLEKLVQRAPVLGGHVPKNADSSLRELAKRNKDSIITIGTPFM